MDNKVYQIVTDRIIAELQKGHIPWRKPWAMDVKTRVVGRKTHTETRDAYVPCRSNGTPYRGINRLLLPLAGEYASFKEIQSRGGHVNKGARGHIVTYWKMLNRPLLDEDGNPVLDDDGKPREKQVPLLRYSTVFHVATQTDLKPRHDGHVTVTVTVVDDPGHVEQVTDKWEDIPAAHDVLYGYLDRERIALHHVHGDDAFYRPSTDDITLPLPEQFSGAVAYYGTALHEAVHSTKKATRCNRDGEWGTHLRWGDKVYAREELVAEIGSSMLKSSLNIQTDDEFTNDTAYVQSWLSALASDPKMIVVAAARAEKAAAYILNSSDDVPEAVEDAE